MDVVLLRWPSESERRDRLSESGVARLLLVEPGEPLPPVVDELEDWVRVPADEVEVQARVSTLSARARAGVSSVPTLDGDGVVRLGDAWTSLPPVEARLLEALLARFGSVVSRGSLAESARWPSPVGPTAPRDEMPSTSTCCGCAVGSVPWAWPSARSAPAAISWSAPTPASNTSATPELP
jgi:hypothetical protein